MSVAVAACRARQPIVIRMLDTPMGGIFEQEKITVPAGTTVVWKNDGAQVHDATNRHELALRASDVAYPAGAAPFDSGYLSAGQSFTYTFKVPGLYRYVCVPHEFGGMTGEVIVTK